MKTLSLNNGNTIPTIGLGVYRMTDDEQTIDVLLNAFELGYRHIDTAAFYENEQAVGTAIKKSGLKRSEIFVTTKMWYTHQKTNTQIQAFEESLDKLGLDYVDMYLVHWPQDGYVEKTWEAMETILQTKRTKSIGVSNHRIQDLQKIIDLKGTIPAVNQIEIHPYFAQDELVNFSQSHTIQVEAWAPFTAGKTDVLNEPILKTIADKYHKTPAQIILRWNIERNIIALPKSSHIERLKQNIDIFDFSLTKDDMAQIKSLNKNERISGNPDDIAKVK